MRFCFGKLKITIIAITIFALPLSAWAQITYKSSNYVIYENIHYKFSGPAISNINVSVDQVTATVTWDTSVLADSELKLNCCIG